MLEKRRLCPCWQLPIRPRTHWRTYCSDCIADLRAGSLHRRICAYRCFLSEEAWLGRIGGVAVDMVGTQASHNNASIRKWGTQRGNANVADITAVLHEYATQVYPELPYMYGSLMILLHECLMTSSDVGSMSPRYAPGCVPRVCKPWLCMAYLNVSPYGNAMCTPRSGNGPPRVCVHAP